VPLTSLEIGDDKIVSCIFLLVVTAVTVAIYELWGNPAPPILNPAHFVIMDTFVSCCVTTETYMFHAV